MISIWYQYAIFENLPCAAYQFITVGQALQFRRYELMYKNGDLARVTGIELW